MKNTWTISMIFFTCSLLLFAFVESKSLDPYKVLGVEKDASWRQIQKAFHKLSLQYHPDKNKNKGAQEKFEEINDEKKLRYVRIITKSAMDRLNVSIMADSLISSIATFHTAKIIVIHPTKYSFIGSIPEAMYACESDASNETDRPAKRGKKSDTQKEPKQKKQKKPTRRLILQSLSDSDSVYIPPLTKPSTHSDSESESSDDEASGRGGTPPRSPTPKEPVRSKPLSPPPVSVPVSIPPITTSQPSTIIPIPDPIFTEATTTTTTGVRTNVFIGSLRT
ncbi:hypothetical protein Lser_V15G41069 [Lactuca serriola]